MQDACLGGKNSTKKDIRQLDFLFVHFVICSLVFHLFKCFPLIVDRCLLFGHLVFFTFYKSIWCTLYISTTIQIDCFHTGPERPLHPLCCNLVV